MIDYFTRELIGWVVIGLMSVRWLLQVNATRKAGKSVLPFSFWIVSFVAIIGGTFYAYLLASTSMFVSGFVGMGIIGYNIYVELKRRRKEKGENK